MALKFSFLLFLLATGASGQDLKTPRPIAAGQSPWTEELTWMEVRDAVAAGKKTILIGTGGVEQNGPYVAGGKHNFVLRLVLPEIAKQIGNALIAPIVKFVPEGDFVPVPTGHLRYPGTISVTQATFEALLTDICRSYQIHGFTDIVLLGDSGGNQAGMRRVAEKLNETWRKMPVRVHFLPEYYEEDMWSAAFLRSQGVIQIDKNPPAGQAPDAPAHTRNGIHDDVYYEAQVAAIDPRLIRAAEREKAGLLTLHGVNLSPVARTAELGRRLAVYRAEITARAFAASRRRLRPTER